MYTANGNSMTGCPVQFGRRVLGLRLSARSDAKRMACMGGKYLAEEGGGNGKSIL